MTSQRQQMPLPEWTCEHCAERLVEPGVGQVAQHLLQHPEEGD